jgi:small-conductance mechanosensitive channel
LVLSLYLALTFIQIPDTLETIINYAMLLVVTFFVVMSINYLIDYSIRRIIKKREKQEKETDTSIIIFLKKLLKGILFGIAFIFILSNLGYDVTTLVTGLGVAGIAIAFALQNVLSDLFASFCIYFDKPFKVGDFIIVGDDLGVVKKIGIRSTRLKSLWGHEIVISNRELTTTRINNYKKMRRRRVHFNFGVVYKTPTKKLKKILKIVEVVFKKIELTDLDRVHFKEFAESSLKFEVAYYVNTGNYNKYMDIQQEINLAIKEQFEKEGIEFAYPTQTIFVSK